MVYEFSRLSKHGGLITYIHNSCSYVKSDIEINSNLFKSSLIEVYPTSNKTVKYLIANLYRIPSDLLDETDRFIDEFTNLLTVIDSKSLRAYICGDYNLNLLKINSDTRCNTLFENLTSLGLLYRITLRESWCDSKTDMNFFNLQGYNMVYEFSRLSKYSGLITYIHNSCSYVKSDIEINSNLFESSLIEVYPTSNKTVKYLIANLYRIPSDLIDETDRFIDEFTNLLTVIDSKSLKAYICGDYNLNLLKIYSDTRCNTLFENLTSLGFIPTNYFAATHQ